MSATQQFHQTANDCLERIAADLWPGAKLALVIYTPDKPELDIVLKDSGLKVDEVVNTLRRRGGLGLDGENIYKRLLCDAILGAMGGGFTPENQDRIALQQIRERRALEDIKAGRIALAISKCSNIWASLPGNNYGQNPHRLDKLLGRWVELGGVLA
ncbi:glycoside hydrolase family protein [Pseudomonas sp. M2(2023)]|uniref:glycoside hydrolase family protein n=1 Tax=Pseudomonas sp. M2(2023) TaxID=3049084 RepID=UPI002553EF30|nr:glycoside hydrolase family protein [Pseudomonas sp. M2(2023)]WIV25876.1 glycoside hydrolase family protein [Pseudomonas sp. M2(2023)]